jgi:hypothetical protein
MSVDHKFKGSLRVFPGRGSFDPMVGQRPKLFVLPSWYSTEIHMYGTWFSILYHSLPFLTCSMVFILDTNWTRPNLSEGRRVFVDY